jgi:hypothetical protein
LLISTRHKEEEVRVMSVVDDSGDIYQLYAGPDPKDPSYPDTKLAVVGIGLVKRGDKKYHALYPERKRFSFQQSVALSQVATALDDAWLRINQWIVDSGHTRTPV